MTQFFSYWFWPNPGNWHYTDPKVQALLIGCVALMLGYFILRYWRSKAHNPITRNLSASWATSSMTFGIIGLILAVSRVETIQFMSMRVLWLVWVLALLGYVAFQFIKFRRKHYVVVKKQPFRDAREKYLPRKKR